MKIEPASIGDAQRISEMIQSLSPPFFLSPGGAGAESFLASISQAAIERYISADNFSYFVAEADGELVGVVAMRDQGHLYHLFVAQRFQGQGFARELWRFIKVHAIQRGHFGKFTVNSSLNAIPVYEAFGFNATGPKVEMNGVAFQPMQLLDKALQN